MNEEGMQGVPPQRQKKNLDMQRDLTVKLLFFGSGLGGPCDASLWKCFWHVQL